MGKNKKPNTQQMQNNAQQTGYNFIQNSETPSGTEADFQPIMRSFSDNYNAAVPLDMANYGRIMSGYQDFNSSIPAPHTFTYKNVNVNNPKEVQEAYGYMREAAPGYREFAQTGGYSNADIQELRARGVNPIRSAYNNTMQELDRARALSGGYSPGYTAALSRANRELPGQIADSLTNINAKLAEDIRQGRLSGLAGLTGIGSSMGQLASADAERYLKADLANQAADLEAQKGTEASIMNRGDLRLRGLGGQTSLYGTTPGMSRTFGDQATQAWSEGLRAQHQRRQQAIDWYNKLTPQQQQQVKKTPWWRKLIGGVAAGAATYFTGGALAPMAGQIYQLASGDNNGMIGNIASMAAGRIPSGGMNLPMSPGFTDQLGTFAPGTDIGYEL